VHQSNPTHNLRFGDLLSMFEGASREWPNNSRVVLVERDAGSAPFRYLIGRLLNTTPGEYKRSLQTSSTGVKLAGLHQDPEQRCGGLPVCVQRAIGHRDC
jgi:hypothetical protein